MPCRFFDIRLFLYSNDNKSSAFQTFEKYEKWFLLWLVSALILAAVSIILHLTLNGKMPCNDTYIRSLLLSGTCGSLDAININGEKFGIYSQLWFLYSGVCSFAFMFLIRKWLGNFWLIAVGISERNSSSLRLYSGIVSRSIPPKGNKSSPIVRNG